jgi:transposase
MILNMIPADKVFIAVGYTDMRRSIDGLAAMVQQVFKSDPCSRNLYLFCGRRSDRIKALYFEGDGFLLLYKRLEHSRFQWPRKESDARQITPQQLRWLLEGLSIEQPRAVRKVDSVLVV